MAYGVVKIITAVNLKNPSEVIISVYKYGIVPPPTIQ